MGLVLLSSCLAGVECTHAGDARTREWALRLVGEGRAVLVCPEVAGGLSVPRPAAEIQGGGGDAVLDGRARVVTSSGEDVTAEFLAGARIACALARDCGARAAVLKARSPSCGRGSIYDGSFSGRTREGDGVAAAALAREGLIVRSDEEIAGH